ncbi:MAG: hypothetical protein KAH77_08975 [Thiomargarita sp.]|nr:hypothetical protein [Thiomargarita sp.]
MKTRTWRIVHKKREKVIFAIVTFLNGMFHVYRTGYTIKRSSIILKEHGRAIVYCSIKNGKPVCKPFTGFTAMQLKVSL